MPLVLLLALSAGAAQPSYTVLPFVQDVGATSAWIVFETSTPEPAAVTWVDSAVASPHDATVTVRATDDGTWIQEAWLDGLPSDHRVTYAVDLGGGARVVADFVTQPPKGGGDGFRLVAMSDMQASRVAPGKFAEVVSEGVLAWAEAEWGDDVADAFALALLPGDLVEDGLDHQRWIDEFFAPVAPLAAHLPLYPVLGNHELNASWYFDYFHLPEDGDPARPEQWWSKTHENVLIVGLDSNLFLTWPDQMAWLDDKLADACADDDIDFVFAELHHPWISEQWLGGQSPLTGQLVEKLEAFSTTCGKPSVHFYGHTHGYSRGQTLEGTHLMVNVAVAGGAIDRWGLPGQIDAEPFSVSTDDWGFVVVDVTGGDDPAIRVRRFSRGDGDVGLDNVLTDEITVRRYDTAPAAPAPLAPGGDVDGACVTFDAAPFADADGDAHQAARWQVAATCDGFDAPLLDVWRQDRNLFFDRDTQAGDDLTDEVVRALPVGAACWRVRYRDDSLGWSDWSTPMPFRVTATTRSANLLPNPGAEDGLADWAIAEGDIEVLFAGACGLVAPAEGARAFAFGGSCDPVWGTRASTVTDLPGTAPGDVAHLGLSLLGATAPGVTLTFLAGDGATLSTWTADEVATGDDWTASAWEIPIPDGAAAARLELVVDEPVLIDALELSVGAPGGLDCAPRPVHDVPPTGGEVDGGCGGCATSPGVGPGLALVALLGLRRRRRA